MPGVLAFAFMTGAVATVNPCGFALLPAYFARRLGTDGQAEADKLTAVVRAIGVGATTAAGFVLIFGVVGGAVALGAHRITRILPGAGLFIGVALLLAGLAIMLGWKIKLRLPVSTRLGRGLGGDFLFGLGYGTASLSCTLPFFMAVTGTALTGSLFTGVASFVAYALGMGTVFTALSVAAAFLRGGLARTVGKLGRSLHRAGGAVLFLAGAYVTYFWSAALFPSSLSLDNVIIAGGERISGALRNWFVGSADTALFVLLSLFAALLSWATWRRFATARARRNVTSQGVSP